MFSPTPNEAAQVPDLFELLLAQGRAMMRTPAARNERLQEQAEAMAARSLQASIRAMERFQWRPRASIALVNRVHCSCCGSITPMFAGFGVSLFRNSDQTERIVMSPALDPAFPRETHYTETFLSSCVECITNQGFNNGQA